MKVVHLGPGGASGRGGIGRTIAYVARAAAQTPDIDIRVIDTYGLRGAWLMPFVFILACARLKIACLFRRVDIAHIHMSQGGSVLRKCTLLLIAKTLGTPVVLHLHGSRFRLFVEALPSFARRVLIWILSRADRIIVIAEAWQRYAQEIGLPRARVVLVHNGVPDRGVPQKHADNSTVTLLALGELGARKGTDDLIAVLSTPSLRSLPWQAVLAGNGPVESYRAQIAAAGLSARIAVPGWVDMAEVGRLLDRADVLLLPSYNEGLPLAILEGLASAVPIVSTPVGGIPDAVIDGKTGLIVAPGDRNALGKAIENLIQDKALRDRLGKNGRQLFLAEFDLESTFKQIAAVYRRLVPSLEFSQS
jgi:glycosyltransferase involved in cell wall biosynthesis